MHRGYAAHRHSHRFARTDLCDETVHRAQDESDQHLAEELAPRTRHHSAQPREPALIREKSQPNL
jgi:hypothetical protein